MFLEETLLFRDESDRYRIDRRDARNCNDNLLALRCGRNTSPKQCGQQHAPSHQRDGSTDHGILPSSFIFSYSAFELKFGFAGFPHQRAPHPFAQFREAGLPQCLARTRIGQIDGDGLMDA